MQGVILAAGMGKRLKNLTQDKTKCMVEVNGISLIERMLRILDKKKLSKIIIVIGYQGEKLKDYISGLDVKTPIVYVENKVFDKTNNIYSLSLTAPYLENEDTLLLESDLIFEEAVIDVLIEDKRENLALVDHFESWMDGTCMILDDEDCIVDMVGKKNLHFTNAQRYFKTVNIYKFSSHFSKYTYVPFLRAYALAMGNNEYYESVIRLIAMLDTKELHAKRLDGQVWYEIDDAQDLDIAESLFIEDEGERYQKIISRFGGFWRYPKMKDFCYIVNPFFPTAHMLEEIQANNNKLVTQYPSGAKVNRLLAGKLFGISAQAVVVGNGAAELIKILIHKISGKVGFIRPTFEEYPNCCQIEQQVVMDTRDTDFQYSAEDICSFFEGTFIKTLVLVNPDNPSGHYLSKNDILILINWCRERDICLILDESFADFADYDLSFLNSSGLMLYDKLYIIKSISKSYGVPGIRLGVLASNDADMMKKVQDELPIWNINSYAEFFLQILEKYKDDYNISLKKMAESRGKMMVALSKIPFLRIFPSQANYVMCELLNDVKSDELAIYLLKKNILIKNLTNKIDDGKEYIRIAVRTEAENSQLIDLLKTYE